ncbi:hypothetical protein SPLC1_S190080 [Arthrospira platensis C1]|nr:hypothetical protein SPLC1_S190080 [Arthrospira platensis C1]
MGRKSTAINDGEIMINWIYDGFGALVTRRILPNYHQ